MAALALLQSGPAVQRSPVAVDMWRALRRIAETGQHAYMQ